MPDGRQLERKRRSTASRPPIAFRCPPLRTRNKDGVPDAPAAGYLLAIKRHPKEVMEAVAK